MNDSMTHSTRLLTMYMRYELVGHRQRISCSRRHIKLVLCLK